MGEKRVIEQVASNEVHNDDWFLKDSPTQDTSKISATNLKAILGADGTLALEEIANAIAEEYDSTHTYYNTGLVFHEGVLYQCTTTSVTGTWDSTKWNVVDIKDLLDNVSTNIGYLWNTISNTIAGNYDTSSIYNTGDYAIYSLKLYRCKDDGVTGAWNSSKWEEVNIPEYIDYVLENAGIVKDVEVDGTSVVNASGVAEITLPDVPVQDVQVKTDSTYDSVVDDSGNAKIDISGKANTSGYYEDFIAGTAENLMADNYIEDKVPYNFRQSFNGARLEDEIVGGTVAWNQLITFGSGTSTNNGITFTRGIDGSITVNGTASTTETPYYLLYYNASMNASHKYIVADSGGNSICGACTNNDLTKRNSIINGGANVTLTVARGQEVNNVKIYPQLFDLTQMFGSTIADYIYSLEQATAGAGIAYFRNLFPKSYYAYNAGMLMSVNASSHDTIGFNQWDEEWELGTYDNTTGAKVNASNRIRSKNYIKCVPNTNYYAKLWQGASYSIRMFYYDANYNFISSPEFIQQGVFTTPNNAYYMTFILAPTYGTTYNHDICINVSNASKNGTYEPYIKHTYPLDSDLTLRGIPKLDSNNKMYYDGDIYESDGSVTRRYGVVDLGGLTWSHASSNRSISNAIANIIKKPATQTSLANLLTSNGYTEVPSNTSLSINGQFAITQSGEMIFYYNGVDEPKGYMVYELATPTSETADAFATPQIVNPKGTEEYVDYAESQGTRDVAIPVGHNSKYYADLKAKIEDIPDVPSANGTYTLKATRSASGVAYNWISG